MSTKEYCWTLPGIGPRGPFDTVKDAIQDAHESLAGRTEDGPHTVEICECDPIHAEDWACFLDVDSAVENMNEYLYDNVSFDDPVFDVAMAGMQEAQNDLCALLTEWAIKHVLVSGAWKAGTAVEEIVIEDD